MKLRGAKITGASLLTILGVICFAGMIVAAANVLTGTFHINQTVTVNPGISMNSDITGGTLYVDEATTYTGVTANVPRALTGATVTITLHNSAGIHTGDVASDHITLHFDGTDFTVTITGTGGDTAWSGSTAIHSNSAASGVVAAANYNSGNTVALTYHVAGTYTIDVTISGNA